MDVPYWKIIALISAVIIVLAKGVSFSLVFYIAGINLDVLEAESNFIHSFMTPIGTISKVSNLLGNLTFDVYKLYAIANYYKYIQKNIVQSLKVEMVITSEEDKRNVASVIQYLYVLLISCVLFSLVAVVFSALGFEVVQHSVGVAMESTTAALMLVLNIWLDKHFMLAIVLHHRISSQSTTKKSNGSKIEGENTKLLEMAGVIQPDPGAEPSATRRSSVLRANTAMTRRTSNLLATSVMSEKTNFLVDERITEVE
ncbi:hypothetical protein HDU99_004074 [Rhizoclosmatium hyalinum]|nr:hypothetical protein HDU99_004074 [Rhizoclosmatium hyalinum]